MDRTVHILMAAEECMLEKGFHGTSVQDIAKRAGISTGLIYRYYKNKDSIIEALVVVITKRMMSHMEKAIAQPKNQTPELFRQNKNNILNQIQNNIFLLMEVSSEATRNEHYKKIIANAHRELQDKIVHHEKELNPHLDEKVIRSRHYFISILIDGIIMQRSRKMNTPNKELEDLINQMLLRVLVPGGNSSVHAHPAH